MSYTSAGSACKEDFARVPIDPNEKVPLPGFRYVAVDQLLTYPIHYENIGDIEARDVFITDTLDPNLDISTLKLLAPGATVNAATRTIAWSLTGRNLAPKAGDSVAFSIKPKPGLPAGTNIANKAKIQFEIFPPLETNTVTHTIDTVNPSCSMSALRPQYLGNEFQISWQGTDPIGEIDYYSIFVSEDGGPYRPAVDRTQARSSVFRGTPGKRYSFFCTSADTAGNLEPVSEAAEASTTLVAGSDVTITAPTQSQVLPVSGVTFSWTAVSGATGYDLRILSGPNTVFQGTIGGQSSTSTLVTLANGSYRFLARACSGGFSDTTCGGFAGVDFSVALAGPANAPSITSPTENQNLTTSTNTIQWTAVPGAAAYEVLLTDAANNTTELQITTTDTSTVYTMHSSASYKLEVRACSSACGPYSAERTFRVTLPAVPTAAPTGLGCTVAGGNQLSCNWNAVTNADVYVLYAVQPNTGPGGGALTVAARRTVTPPLTLLPVPKGPAGVIVAACTGDGCGPLSTAFNINPAGPNPATPIIGTPIAGSTVAGPFVQFSWSRLEGDTGTNAAYRLYAGDLSRASAAINVLTQDNFYGGVFRSEGTRYDAVAIGTLGSGAPTASPPNGFVVTGASATTPTMVAPRHQTEAIPSSIPAGNITLGWTPVAGAGLYQYYVTIQGAAAATAQGITPGLIVVVPLTANATKYSGIVRACIAGSSCTLDSDAGWGPWSNSPGGSGVTNFLVQ